MININNNHNVYILGAGFSVDAGMPLVSNFITKMKETAVWLEENNRQVEFQSIEKVFKFRKESASAAYRLKINIDNIENLFSLASAVDQKSLGDSIVNAITATLNYCESTAYKKMTQFNMTAHYAEKFHLEIKKADLSIPVGNGKSLEAARYDIPEIDYYAFILGGCLMEDIKQNNSIITFNYDIELEKSLIRLNIPYNYGMKLVNYDYPDHNKDNPESLPILKLHGSVNWAYPEDRGKKLTVYKSYKEAFEKAKYRVLIPPTWQKIFTGPIQSVWQNAVNVLSTATRIIIIGFSLPETDIHFKYLLAAGLKDNISLREIIFINIEEEKSMMNKIYNMFQHEFIENDNIKYIQQPISLALSNRKYLLMINRLNKEIFI